MGAHLRLMPMHFFGKAKSHGKEAILPRPIAAASQPFISRYSLRVAARPFTWFLCLLVESLSDSILILTVANISA